MANTLMKGRLMQRIHELRGEGASWENVAKRLYAEGGVDVTAKTLQAWAAEVGQPSDPSAAAS